LELSVLTETKKNRSDAYYIMLFGNLKWNVLFDGNWYDRIRDDYEHGFPGIFTDTDP